MAEAANPAAARHVLEQAAEVGFSVDQEIGSAAVVFPRDMSLDSPLLSNALSVAVAAGIVTEDEAAALTQTSARQRRPVRH